MHAGNIWVLDDGRGCYLDFGIMGELTTTGRAWSGTSSTRARSTRTSPAWRRAYRRVGVFPDDMGTDEEIGERIGRSSARC